MTPEKLSEWMERLRPDLLRFLRAVGYPYDAEDVVQTVWMKLISVGEKGSQANPPPCTTYRGDPDNRDHVFRWLCSWVKNEARNAQKQAWNRRETELVEEWKPGASHKRRGSQELLDAATAEDGPPAPEETGPQSPPRIPSDQLRASMQRFKEVENEKETPSGLSSEEVMEDNRDLWIVLTDIELDLNAVDSAPEPRRRGRPVKWDETETQRVFANFLHIRRALRYAGKEFARVPGEPDAVYEGRLTNVLLEFDQWLREDGPISYRAKPDPNHVAAPGTTRIRWFVPVWPPLSQTDARGIARQSKGHETALTIGLIAHYYRARPDQIRGVPDWARKLAVLLAPSLTRTGATTTARRQKSA
jgi:DNA-directed RNA polymerase specialized sigma24 family protein